MNKNFSAPLLPPGLSQSQQLRPFLVLNAGSYVGMVTVNCPYLYPSGLPDDTESILSNWQIDPGYYLFQGCICPPVRETEAGRAAGAILHQ